MTRFLELADLTDDELRELYAPRSRPWLRLSFVATVDGSTQGADGLSTGIRTAGDERIFLTLRSLAEVIVVGAGTARAEGYEPGEKPLVLVSRSARVPASLRSDLSRVHLATASGAEHLAQARELLGDRVLELGEEEPDLDRLIPALAERGWSDIMCEGGPSLATDLWAQGLVDELATTLVPRVVAGEHPRMAHGVHTEVALELASVVSDGEGGLLLRYLRA